MFSMFGGNICMSQGDCLGFVVYYDKPGVYDLYVLITIDAYGDIWLNLINNK